MTGKPTPPKFIGSLLRWPVERSVRAFRAYVVEPKEYLPHTHGEIFNAALSALLGIQAELLDPFAVDTVIARAEQFDLVTFPEAFLPQQYLLEALAALPALGSIGCIHAGLRPNADNSNHLFSKNEIEELVGSLRLIPQMETSDLDAFSGWLLPQSSDGMFNLGCLFTVDANSKLRICIHPKLVRSKFEASPLSEQYMSEGNLLSLVILLPTDNRVKSVTVQPLLCSDALHSATDRPNNWPLDGINDSPECFDCPIPDHVDVVSLALCTPHQSAPSKALQDRGWHQDFLDTFRRAQEMHRHNFATFVCSNFQEMPNASPGGLSGGFIPIPSHKEEFPPYAFKSAWGRDETSPNRWSTPYDDISTDKWSSLGYLVALAPTARSGFGSTAMLGFTVQQLPRDMTWSSRSGFVNFQLRRSCGSAGALTFEKAEL